MVTSLAKQVSELRRLIEARGHASSTPLYFRLDPDQDEALNELLTSVASASAGALNRCGVAGFRARCFRKARHGFDQTRHRRAGAAGTVRDGKHGK